MARSQFQAARKVYRAVPVKIEQHTTGWLGPDGKFFACAYWGHLTLARKLYYRINGKSAAYCGSYDDWLERNGWRKLQDGRWFFHDDGRVTQAQLDAMFRWCRARNVPMPLWAHVGDGPLAEEVRRG